MDDLQLKRVPGNTLGGRLTPHEIVLASDGKHQLVISEKLFDRLGENAARDHARTLLTAWEQKCQSGQCGNHKRP